MTPQSESPRPGAATTPAGLAPEPGSAAAEAVAFFERLEVASAPMELVALGGRLEPATVFAAYRAGCFPWPATGPYAGPLDRDARRLARTGKVPLVPGTEPGDGPLLPWSSPHPRPVLIPQRVTVPRSLRKTMRSCGWEATMDADFDAVIAACADRDETWITAGMDAAYRVLHRSGVAHSLEVWSGAELVGGLYGVRTGRVFAGESMFHRVPYASKAAVVDLCERLTEAGIVVIDTQDESDHMRRLGQILVRRADYVDVVHRFRDEPVQLRTGRLPVARLLRD